MLRRLEKNLSGAKSKSQTEATVSAPYPAPDSQTSSSDATHYSGLIRADTYGPYSNSQYASVELPPLKLPQSYDGDGRPLSNQGSRDTMDEDDDPDQAEDTMFPGPMIKKESRHSFFNTILNPPEQEPSSSSPVLRPAPLPEGFHDPVTAGLITEQDADAMFDMIWLRLNPFINLFDPALHNVAYVRSKCPFLFSVLMMAGAKFFKPDIFRECLKIANDLAVQAFARGWKRVEVVQAFACLTYWKEPDDNVCASIVILSPRLTND